MTKYSDLEKKIGIKFKDQKVLENAFVHSSFVNEHKNKDVKHNERLEFLGDAVLELVATTHLYVKYPDQHEGHMTTYRSALVKGNHLAEIARELSLGKYLLLSHGEELSHGREKNPVLADTLEALIGAIYLDQGYKKAEAFIRKFILAKLDEIIEKGLHIDAKSRFQEMCQDREGITPAYLVLAEEGPDHDKTFTMGAYIGKKLIAKGIGSSKQKAEQEAAKNALMKKEWL